MTSTQMALEFKIRLDKIDSLNYPNFEPSEIDSLLNQAQERFTKQRYGNTNTKRESFEETQKRTEDLKTLVRHSVLTPLPTAADNINTNSQFVLLPSDHWFIVWEGCTISYEDCHSNTVEDVVPIYPIQHNDYNKIIKHSFLKPNKNRVLRLMENGRVEIIHDSDSTVINYKMRYVKQPVKISSIAPLVDCELPEHTHDEIVNEAVKLALEGIESRRQQTFTTIERTEE